MYICKCLEEKSRGSSGGFSEWRWGEVREDGLFKFSSFKTAKVWGQESKEPWDLLPLTTFQDSNNMTRAELAGVSWTTDWEPGAVWGLQAGSWAGRKLAGHWLADLGARVGRRLVTSNIILLALLNVRSLAGKSFVINGFMTYHKLDVMFLTESESALPKSTWGW